MSFQRFGPDDRGWRAASACGRRCGVATAPMPNGTSCNERVRGSQIPIRFLGRPLPVRESGFGRVAPPDVHVAGVVGEERDSSPRGRNRRFCPCRPVAPDIAESIKTAR